MKITAFAITTAALLARSVLAQEVSASFDAGTLDKSKAAAAFQKRPYSPYADRKFPTRPLFGDQHLHTSFSMDAGAFGARLSPSDAYRFARGEQVISSTGQPAKLSRPLDWLVVTDHSDNMGFFPDLFAGNPEILANPTGRKWYDMVKSGKGADAAIEIIVAFSHGTFPNDIMYFPGTRAYKNAWRETIDTAEKYNEPGRFTAFIGYEWTSNTGGNNLHRNVVYRDGAEKAVQMEPFTVYPPYGSDNPVKLWEWMAAYEKKTGGSVLAIAHNGNLSNGLMFPTVEQFGKPVDKEYAEQRAKWERLYEATQTKGDGETHPFLSPKDEFADFERWDKGNLDGSVAKKKEMLEFEYARSAYKNGLKLEVKLGVNPYKFGLVSGSDAHNALAAMEEDNFFGKTVPQEPSPERTQAAFVDNPKTGVKIMDWEVCAGGYAAVWATTRAKPSGTQCSARRPIPRPAPAWLSGSSADGILRRLMRIPGIPHLPAIARGCRWAAISAKPRQANRPPSLSRRSRTRSAQISIASRSSRAGWMRAANCARKFMMSPGVATASRTQTASCRASAAPWIS